MKITSKILVIIATFVAIFIFLRLTDGSSDTYTRQLDSLRNEVFSLKREHRIIMEHLLQVQRTTDSIKVELRQVKANTDTLKIGQSLIFDEVKKVNDKSFWDLFR